MIIQLKVKRIDLRTKFIVMATEKIVAKVTRVQVFTVEGNTNVKLTLNKSIKAFKETEKNSNVFEEIERNSISMFASEALKVAESNEIAAFFMSVVENIYSQEAIGKMFFGAQIIIEQELHAKGEVINEKALDRDKWYNALTKYTPGEMSIKLMEKIIGL